MTDLATSEGRDRPDLRMPLVATLAWLLVLTVLLGPRWLAPAAVVVACAWWWTRRRKGAFSTTTGAALLVAAVGAACVASVHAASLTHGPVAGMAQSRATVSAVVVTSTDPKVVRGEFGDRVLVRGLVVEMTGRGRSWRVREPVVLLADPAWIEVRLGSRVRLDARAAPAEGDAAALLLATSEPEVLNEPEAWWDAAEAVRQSLRESVEHRPVRQRALVPALVVGDDAAVPEDLAEEFRATGLTHLLAVSGTNLTLLVGFLLVLARGLGVRGRWLLGVGALGIVGFVLLARTEPSVVRAAAMGTVALLGLGRNGLRRGTRGLGVAVLVLLLWDPWLSTSAGFALSVLATAGILFLAPSWRDALAGWLPRWLAEAIAVPAAAQVACTPVVAAISGQVSLVAVVANLAAAPAVGPTTVLGLAAGVLGLLWDPLGTWVGTLAAWCVGWIVVVAEIGSGLPTAAISWGTSVPAIATLTLGCVGVALVSPYVLRRRTTGLACAVLMVASVLLDPPTPGWPPKGWVAVACDVGQGDALVLRAGPESAVVVDAGPDPVAVDGCLDRLGVDHVPLLVLTHFHADHVDGVAGVYDDRRVDEVWVSPLLDPASGVRLVQPVVRPSRVRVGAASDVGTYGDVRVQVIGPTTLPTPTPRGGSADGEGSAANNASLVLIAEVRGVRILLTGDVEPPAQAGLSRLLAGVDVDVLKVPHHGSRHQELDLLLGVRPEIALISVGADNGYGHPSADTVVPLEESGAVVGRTDLSGDLAVVERGDRLALRLSRGSS